MKDEKRTIEQLREHYEIEKKLANKLRHSSKEQRHVMYASLYTELFQRVPLHPRLTGTLSPPTEIAQRVHAQMRFLGPFLKKDSIFLEVGSGDCALSLAVTKLVKNVYAVDISEELSKKTIFPKNFQLVISKGSNIPIPHNSVNIAYSNQLMEHLHPDDAIEQLQNLYKTLVPGGLYLCITPNRLTGPHDISAYFDTVATGFHLKEYTVLELSNLFRQVGFSQVIMYVGIKGKYLKFPVCVVTLFERFLEKMPLIVRKFIRINKLLPSIRLVGIK